MFRFFEWLGQLRIQSPLYKRPRPIPERPEPQLVEREPSKTVIYTTEGAELSNYPVDPDQIVQPTPDAFEDAPYTGPDGEVVG